VYRRNVPGSHTMRMNLAPVPDLLEKMETTLGFIGRLKEFPGIPEDSVDRKIYLVRMDYGLRFIVVGDHAAYRAAVNVRSGGRWWEQFVLDLARRSKSVFLIYRFAISFFLGRPPYGK